MFIRPAEGQITSQFRTKGQPSHNGIDIVNKGAIPIHAAEDGIISRTYVSKTYGEAIFVLHVIDGQVWETVYAHLQQGSRKHKLGDKVQKGDVIAYMGDTGDATAQHLHFELHKGRWNAVKSQAVNPMPYMEDLPQKMEQKRIATVKVKELNLRKEPAFNAPVIKVLKQNEKYRFYGYANGYWANLGGGYASNKDGIYLDISHEANFVGTAEVLVKELNLRSGPGLNYPVIKTIFKGINYKVYEIRDGWYNLGSGWASNMNNSYLLFKEA